MQNSILFIEKFLSMKTIKIFIISLLIVPVLVFTLSPIEGLAQNRGELPEAGLAEEKRKREKGKQREVDGELIDQEEDESVPQEIQSQKSESAQQNVRWEYDGAKWFAVGNLPQCPKPPALKTPVNMNYVASILYPGQYRGNHYKAHGGFGFEGYGNAITVRAPITAELYGGVHYMQDGVEQYMFDFIAPCGIMYRFDHLSVLSPKLDAYAKTLPLQIEDSRFRRKPTGIIFEVGEEVATGVGMTGNPFIDFGVYDLRKKNDASKDSAWSAIHPGEQTLYAVCWFDWLSEADSKRAWELPPRGGDSSSDYCK